MLVPTCVLGADAGRGFGPPLPKLSLGLRGGLVVTVDSRVLRSARMSSGKSHLPVRSICSIACDGTVHVETQQEPAGMAADSKSKLNL